ncbi:hypothetical protein D3C73_1579160 [compost metagenome]
MQIIQLQRVRQLGTGLERLGTDLQLGRQLFGQRLQLTTEPGVQVAATVASELEGFLQLTLNLYSQLPVLAIDLGQP